MNYLFLGQEGYLKEEGINNLKSKFLSKDLGQLNFSIYHAGTDDINEILYCINTLPCSDKFRIVLIKDIDKFNSREKEILLEYLKKPFDSTILILESDKEMNEDQFFIKAARLVTLRSFRRPTKENEDMSALINSISEKKIDRAFSIISELILRKRRPHEIIGLLAWHYRTSSMGGSHNRFAKDKLKKNIELLLSTDLAIKRSQVNPLYALEFAILKLCG